MKKKSLSLVCLLLALGLAFPSNLNAQTNADPSLVAEINSIRAVDNHAHPQRALNEGETDADMDALHADALEPFPLPVRLRPDNTEYIGAWRSLYGYTHDDMSEAHVRELSASKARLMREKGEGYPSWVLDQLGIEVMLANRVAMGRGLPTGRFRWVPFADALLFPLDTARVRNLTADYAVFYPQEEKLLQRHLSDLKLTSPPATLPEYLSRVVTPTLELQRRGGAIAIKFAATYLRTLEFDDAPEAEAARVYARYAKGGAPSPVEYKALQDFLFRHMAREAGRLGLAVHIHVGSGIGGSFRIAASNPLLLESVLNDPSLRKTSFVLIHGGWPFDRQAGALLYKPNVYIDFSAQTFLHTPSALAEMLRAWLAFVPEKVLFGTDSLAVIPPVSWEEVAWLSNKTAREALALALTGMVRDGEITRARASELARMVLRENAVRLYGLK